MIIFYNKKTGLIIGTINGRVHSDQEFSMWIGDKNDNDRIIVEWENSKPITNQSEIFIDIDNKKINIFNYKVDIKTKKLCLI